MRIKVLVKRNLRMSTGKVAAQSVHAVLGLASLVEVETYSSVVVLAMSDRKFEEIRKELAEKGHPVHVVRDAGITEVEPGTETCLAYVEGL